jgi:serine/threonine-protein kinase
VAEPADEKRDDADVTRTTIGKPATSNPVSPAVPGSGPNPSTPSGQGWFAASGVIDHGRFSPGAILEGRYRIVGLLGRGGMGEVYRADDLRLGQQVAIKFLPSNIVADTARLAQFHNEVRMARQVSHPNVCRVHDIGEVASGAGAQIFITMEYVDGEDLAASLKRVGRFPEDKALDLARQIAAGLAAAHDRGVIHRDLKPANIMLDKNGEVRLMDFGLAAAGTAADVQAGTPAYMAPEQLAGREVTLKSDLFALGLVLHELFTGKKVFNAKTIADLIRQQEAGVQTPPSDLVKGLNPAIENAILWCLDRDPSRRPPSALALSAALPGSDPLAAALAAGETPSPAMVAAAGRSAAALSPVAAAAVLAAGVLMLIASAALADRTILPARVPFDRAAASLTDHARDLGRTLGYATPVADRASGFTVSPPVMFWLRESRQADQNQLLAAGTPATLMFWYRTSPQLMLPNERTVSVMDPPPLDPGMTMMTFDTSGRLYRLIHSPEQNAANAAPVDWPALLRNAGYDASKFSPASPAWTPPVFADTRAAFTGELAELPGVPVRIEAGSAAGHVTSFRLFGPWSPLPSTTAAPADPGGDTTALIASIATALIAPGMMLAGALVARHNVRKGRGDRAGALRIAAATLLVALAGWLFEAHHVFVADIELSRFFTAVGSALFDASVVWLFYLAAEPQVRKVWPHILITWSRLISSGARDPLVGRDLVIGAAAGALMTLLSYFFYLTPHWIGVPDFVPRVPVLLTLGETRFVVSTMLLKLANALQNAMLGVLGLALLRMLLKKQWLVFAAATLIFAPLAARGQFQSGVAWLDLLFGVALVAAILGVIIRFGLFAGIVAFFTHFWTYGAPLTLNSAHQYFQTSLFALGIVIAMAAAGVMLARGPVHSRA